MIIHKENLDYAKHCTISFGTYVQAHNEPTHTNSQQPRTLDCIYLRFINNKQGGHELLDLRTGAIITRRNVTPLPITQNIINIVHAMADKEQMPTGFKITSRDGNILHDSEDVNFAGVETTIEEDDDEYEDNNHKVEDEKDEIDPNDIGDIIEPTNTKHVTFEDDNNDDYSDKENVNEEDETYNNNDDIKSTDDEDDPTIQRTRSGRRIRPPEKLSLSQYHIPTQGYVKTEYTYNSAKVFTMAIQQWMQKTVNSQYQFIQTYGLKAGIKQFGEKGKEAAYQEMKQIHDRKVFEPIDASKLSVQEKRKALESLLFLVEKNDETVKGRTCANGSRQRDYIDRSQATSPTVATESVFLTAVVEAEEQRDIMTNDLPNAFVQTDLNPNDESIYMKIRGILVDMLLELDPEVYKDYIVYEGEHKVIYVRMLKALYGMVQLALLFYTKFKEDLQVIGFKVYNYDPCVANCMVRGNQQTVTWHVDDVKSSHIDPKTNDEFYKWLESKYGDVS